VYNAVEAQPAWGLGDYIAVLWRRKWIVLEALIILPAVAVGIAMSQPSVYRASADVLLNRSNIGATVLGVPDPLSYEDPTRVADTQAVLASTPDVAAKAARIANIPGITGDYVLASGDVRAGTNSDLLRFSITGRRPDVDVRLATAYAQAFIDYRSELDTSALRQARSDLSERLSELRAAGETRSTLYATLSDKEQQLRTLELLQVPNKLVRPATDAFKISPKPVRNGVLGFIGGIILGIGVAFLVEMLDRRVRSEDEIERMLRLPLLARVPDPPRFAREKNKLVMLADPRSIHAEPFRRLRTNLEFVNAEAKARTILVTSAIAGEGKSTTVANLAVAAARAGRRVVVVDLDLRRPTLHDWFGVPQGPGATNVALGAVELEDVLRTIRLPHGPRATSTNGNGASATLEFLPAGTLPPNPGEFLGTKGIAEMLSALGRRGDLVFVDAPPLLAVGDTLPLSARVDGLVVVTRFGVVSRPMLSDLARELDTLPTAKLGFVITGADAGEAYGFGYGYEEPDGVLPEADRPRRSVADPTL